MKERTKAYTAGLLDAEGCLTIARLTRRSGNIHYEPCLTITNSNEMLGKWLVKNFGGDCYWKKAYSTNTKPWFIWKPGSYKHANTFLSLIYPYLIIKKQEADILFNFYALADQDVPNIRESLCRQIKGLKNRESVTTETSAFHWPANLVNAYFSGFFDGEGTTGVFRNGKNLKPRVRTSLENTSKFVVESLQKIYGGAVYNRGIRKTGYQNIWQWQLDKTRKQELFLLKILPYLVIKRQQAKKSLNAVREKRYSLSIAGDRESAIAKTQLA